MHRNYNLDMICKLAKRPCYFLLKPESLVSANLRAINEHLLEVQERARFTGSMTLEFEEAIKVLEEHIEILKQNLLFLMAEHKPENITQIITLKRELDKAVQEKMKLSQVYCRPLVFSSPSFFFSFFITSM